MRRLMCYAVYNEHTRSDEELSQSSQESIIKAVLLDYLHTAATHFWRASTWPSIIELTRQYLQRLMTSATWRHYVSLAHQWRQSRPPAAAATASLEHLYTCCAAACRPLASQPRCNVPPTINPVSTDERWICSRCLIFICHWQIYLCGSCSKK